MVIYFDSLNKNPVMKLWDGTEALIQSNSCAPVLQVRHVPTRSQRLSAAPMLSGTVVIWGVFLCCLL